MKTNKLEFSAEFIGLRCQDNHWQLTYLITLSRGNQRLPFHYFVGVGCVPWEKARPHLFPVAQQSIVEMGQNRFLIRDQQLLAETAANVARFTRYTPSLNEVLECLALDSSACDCSFEDWCSELGYDPGSRKAEDIYRACQTNGFRLRKLLTMEEIEQAKQGKL